MKESGWAEVAMRRNYALPTKSYGPCFMGLSRKFQCPVILALTWVRGGSRSLFIGGGQRGLRFGGRLLCLLGTDGWMIWLLGWVICCFCCLGVGFGCLVLLDGWG